MRQGLVGVLAILGALGLVLACSGSPSKRAVRGEGGAAGDGRGSSEVGDAGNDSSIAGDDGSGDPARGGQPDGGGAPSVVGVGGGAAGERSSEGEAGEGGRELPSAAGIRLSWVFQGAVSGDALTCEETGGTHVHVRVGKGGTSEAFFEETIACAELSRTIVVEEFAYYAIELTLTNANRTQFLGEAEQLFLPLSLEPCDEIVDGVCLQVEEAVIVVDGS